MTVAACGDQLHYPRRSSSPRHHDVLFAFRTSVTAFTSLRTRRRWSREVVVYEFDGDRVSSSRFEFSACGQPQIRQAHINVAVDGLRDRDTHLKSIAVGLSSPEPQTNVARIVATVNCGSPEIDHRSRQRRGRADVTIFVLNSYG